MNKKLLFIARTNKKKCVKIRLPSENFFYSTLMTEHFGVKFTSEKQFYISGNFYKPLYVFTHNKTFSSFKCI